VVALTEAAISGLGSWPLLAQQTQALKLHSVSAAD
jgi:hypothetical protein